MLNTRPALMNASFGSGESSAPSGSPAPRLSSFAAPPTLSRVIMFAVPRWSPAPHLDGQRSLSGGMRHPSAGGGLGGRGGAGGGGQRGRGAPVLDFMFFFC